MYSAWNFALHGRYEPCDVEPATIGGLPLPVAETLHSGTHALEF